MFNTGVFKLPAVWQRADSLFGRYMVTIWTDERPRKHKCNDRKPAQQLRKGHAPKSIFVESNAIFARKKRNETKWQKQNYIIFNMN